MTRTCHPDSPSNLSATNFTVGLVLGMVTLCDKGVCASRMKLARLNLGQLDNYEPLRMFLDDRGLEAKLAKRSPYEDNAVVQLQ